MQRSKPSESAHRFYWAGGVRLIKKFCYCVTILIVLLACIPSQAGGDDFRSEDRIIRFCEYPFDSKVAWSIHKWNAIESVTHKFGKPISSTTEFFEGNDFYTNKVTQYIYKGVNFRFSGDAESSGERIIKIEISGSEMALLYGLSVGDSGENFIESLGLPFAPDKFLHRFRPEMIWVVSIARLEPGKEEKGEYLATVSCKIMVGLDDADRIKRIQLNYGPGH